MIPTNLKSQRIGGCRINRHFALVAIVAMHDALVVICKLVKYKVFIVDMYWRNHCCYLAGTGKHLNYCSG